MSQTDHKIIDLAAGYWASGQPLEAGKLIYETLPSKLRPKWASRILQVVLARSGIQSPLLDEVLVIATQQDMWKHGHSAFSALRTQALRLDELRQSRELSEEEVLLASILSLAELVAKVIYNATAPPDEFDEDSGWWIAVCLRYFVDHLWKDESFANSAWTVLSSRD